MSWGGRLHRVRFAPGPTLSRSQRVAVRPQNELTKDKDAHCAPSVAPWLCESSQKSEEGGTLAFSDGAVTDARPVALVIRSPAGTA